MAEMLKQEYVIINLDSGDKTYFYAHSFKSAYQHTQEYIKRNKDKIKMQLKKL